MAGLSLGNNLERRRQPVANGPLLREADYTQVISGALCESACSLPDTAQITDKPKSQG